MLVTESGIINSPVNPLQPENAENPMLVTEFPIVNESVKPSQPSNA